MSMKDLIYGPEFAKRWEQLNDELNTLKGRYSDLEDHYKLNYNPLSITWMSDEVPEEIKESIIALLRKYYFDQWNEH